MKKLLSVLIALSMLFCAVSALAEETVVTEVENEPSYEGVYVNIGDTGLAMYVPADYATLETPEGAVMAMGNDEVAMTVILIEDTMESITAQVNQAEADGTMINVIPLNINALDFLTGESADATQNVAYFELDDNQVLSFVFVAAPDYQSNVPAEIIGSLLDAEETTEAE